MRITLELTYTGLVINEKVPQCTLFKFEDADGNKYSWVTTGSPAALDNFHAIEGEKVKLSARVDKSNTLSYVKFL